MKKFCIILFALLLGHEVLRAQDWVSTNGPGGGFTSIEFNGNKDMFVCNDYLLRTTDKGVSWKFIAPNAPQSTTWKIAIAPNNDIYLTGIADDTIRIWKSTDNGDSWGRIWVINVGALFIGPEGNIYIVGDNNFQEHMAESIIIKKRS